MTWGQAIVYFFSEALTSLRRGWRVSLLAILTIAVSLFLGGVFRLLGINLAGQLEQWQGEARVVAYFAPETRTDRLADEAERLRRFSWIESVEVIDEERARGRFERVFPDLADLLDDPEAEPLPASLELTVAEAALADTRELLTRELESIEGVEWVDDDARWLERLQTLVTASRRVGLALGGLLLAAAVFTIASVIRLTAYRYREEIAVMRQVGATELVIRCPFYVEGFLQGLAGGVLATGGLWLFHLWLRPDGPGEGVRDALAGSFLPAGSILLLVCFGALAGTAGAILSLPREVFGAGADLDSDL